MVVEIYDDYNRECFRNAVKPNGAAAIEKIVGQCFPNAKAVPKRNAYDETKISRSIWALKGNLTMKSLVICLMWTKGDYRTKISPLKKKRLVFKSNTCPILCVVILKLKKHLHFFWSNSFHGCLRYSYPTGRTWYFVIIVCHVKWKHICFTEKYSDFTTVSAWFTMEHLSSDIQVVTWSVSYFYQAALH